MTPREANVFLTKAALLDPFIVPDADRAEAWAELLPDVTLAAALGALHQHYRTESARITPARVLDLAGAGVVDPYARWRDTTSEVLAESKARVLAAAGVSEEEFEARKDDPVWVRSKFAQLQLEAGEDS